MSDYNLLLSGNIYAALASDVGTPIHVTSSSTVSLAASGTYSGSYSKHFVVACYGATNTFRWSDDAGVTWEASGVTIATTAVSLAEGVEVTFSAATAIVGDQWDFWTGVTPVAANEFATFQGQFALEWNATLVTWYGQRLVALDAAVTRYEVKARCEKVNFKAATFEKFWDLTKTTSAALRDASKLGTHYKFTWDSRPLAMELLLKGGYQSTGKVFEAYMPAVRVGSMPFSFSISDYMSHNMEFTPFADANGLLIDFTEEA